MERGSVVDGYIERVEQEELWRRREQQEIIRIHQRWVDKREELLERAYEQWLKKYEFDEVCNVVEPPRPKQCYPPKIKALT
jgi:hypothetical protein